MLKLDEQQSASPVSASVATRSDFQGCRMVWLAGWLCLMGSPAGPAIRADETSRASAVNTPAHILVTVNGKSITSADLQLDFYLMQLEASPTLLSREELLQRLIDRELVRQFLTQRKISAEPQLLEQRLNVVRRLVAMKGDELPAVLAKIGLDEAALQEMLALQIAWNRYLTTTLTESRIQKHWQAQREQFDGTQVAADQIFKRVDRRATEAESAAAQRSLQSLKAEIERGTVTFAAAARQHSESPSGAQGGNLGLIEYHGDVAPEIAQAAFATPVGQLSEPVRSPYGWHLVQVRERITGELSLEDARPVLLANLSEVLWQEQVTRLRSTARIEFPKP